MSYKAYYWLFLIVFFLPLEVFGQGFLSGNRTSIEISNQYPEPGEQLQATVKNQDSANLPGDIIWRINGDIKTSFTNKRTIDFTAGNLGRPTVIQVLKRGTPIAQTLVNPVYVDIHVDPLTYTPKNYHGRPEVTPDATVLLTALVSEVQQRSYDAYTYTWKVNGTLVDGGPWPERHRISVTAPIGSRVMEVELTVSRPGIGVVSNKIIEIPITSTDTQLYGVNNLYGTNPTAINSQYNLLESNLTVRAIPYFMPIEAMQGNIDTTWRLDNRILDNPNPFQITIEPGRRQRGVSNLSFQQYSPNSPYQQANSSVRINF